MYHASINCYQPWSLSPNFSSLVLLGVTLWPTISWALYTSDPWWPGKSTTAGCTPLWPRLIQHLNLRKVMVACDRGSIFRWQIMRSTSNVDGVNRAHTRTHTFEAWFITPRNIVVICCNHVPRARVNPQSTCARWIEVERLRISGIQLTMGNQQNSRNQHTIDLARLDDTRHLAHWHQKLSTFDTSKIGKPPIRTVDAEICGAWSNGVDQFISIHVFCSFFDGWILSVNGSCGCTYCRYLRIKKWISGYLH